MHRNKDTEGHIICCEHGRYRQHGSGVSPFVGYLELDWCATVCASFNMSFSSRHNSLFSCPPASLLFLPSHSFIPVALFSSQFTLFMPTSIFAVPSKSLIYTRCTIFASYISYHRPLPNIIIHHFP